MQALLLRITNGCFQHCKDLEHHCKTLGCNHDEVFTYLQVDYEYFYSEFSFKQHSTECISVIYAYHNCGLVFHLNCIVLFRMPKSKEVLSSSSDSDSDSEVDTKVWKQITMHYTFNYTTLSNAHHIYKYLYPDICIFLENIHQFYFARTLEACQGFRNTEVHKLSLFRAPGIVLIHLIYICAF